MTDNEKKLFKLMAIFTREVATRLDPTYEFSSEFYGVIWELENIVVANEQEEKNK